MVEVLGAPMSSMAARFCSSESGTKLKNLFSFTEPVGPPSALAPLSEMQHDQRVVELTDLPEEVEQPADVVVGVLEESGEHLHHAGIQPPLVR